VNVDRDVTEVYGHAVGDAQGSRGGGVHDGGLAVD
jgi:hypothetical protein